MRKIFLILSTPLFLIQSNSQQLTSLPSGGNKRALVKEQVGLCDITIRYDRPGVKGREGKIWGQLVHAGYTYQGFGSAMQAPWRAGANESTTMEFSTPVKIEGKDLPAGKYGFFIAYDPNESTLIFSKNNVAWGSYYYNEKDDALRVKVKPQALDKSVEWLKYEFVNQTDHGATIALMWEKLMFPFKVETDYISNQLAIFRNELQTNKGFTWTTWDQAAQWALQNNVNLDEALLWADSATSQTFGGNFIFQPQSTKAMILEKLGRGAEAEAIMKKALPMANMFELHQYARRLVAQKKAKQALEVFKINHDKNPNQFTTLVGLTRGYSADGNYKMALQYAEKALPLAPDNNNKASVQAMVTKLKEGKDVN